ncbi:uncharacterized protein LOC134260223 [Saccostrea cucullata]|uniref:uncharacterized protein LOC134260223 n=1 Tax=Saccostrea cuccullata TaxID=36930 RepID=UPI002ED1F2A5
MRDAYQLTKAIRAADLEAAKKLTRSQLKAKLENSTRNPIFAEGTYDMQWGTGLDSEATLHTDHKKWPGQNKLGKIYQKLASKHARKLRRSSLPRKGTSENQTNIEDFLKDLKKGSKKNTSVKGPPQTHSLCSHIIEHYRYF